MANRIRSHSTRAHHGPRRGGSSVEGERSLLDTIASGELDQHLAALAAAIDARRHLLHTVESSHALATLRIGDRVRINGRISPRYLVGLDATVVELDDRAATIRLAAPVGRFTSGRLRCPPLALEKLPAGQTGRRA